MPPKKERYNAKARQSVAGEHTHKRKKVKAPSASAGEATDEGQASEPIFDPNADILDEDAKERDRQRRKLLAEAGQNEHMPLSSKKKKRLDKYIDSRIKKEERGEILAKLAQSSQEVTNRSELKSAATLGTGKVRSVGERVEKLIGKEQKTAESRGRVKRKRGAAFDVDEDDDDADLDEREDEDTTSAVRPPKPQERVVSSPTLTAQQAPEPVELPEAQSSSAPQATTSLAPLPLPASIGSALALGPDGKPIVVMRKKRTKKVVRKAAQSTEDDKMDVSDDEAEKPVDASSSAAATNTAVPAPTETKPKTSSRPLLEMAAAISAPDEVQRTEEGETLQPLLGMSVKVKEMMDPEGVARGPLGHQESRPDEISPFAKKVYEEFRAAFSSRPSASTSASSANNEDGKEGILKEIVRNVSVKRSEDLMAARMRLPIVAEEDRIIKTILENPVVVLCGETGSGKTTQVPQFLYEAGFGTPGSLNPGLIGITQPRRVAALSTAARVRSELSLPESRVSHQIRYDATVSAQTSIKFLTDGVLLREVASDFLLEKYSAILVDEAHERSVNTDVLIGVLSRIVRLREKRWLEGRTPHAKPLRLVIMSATLRVADFTENKTLFPIAPPVLNIEARQHPVTVHFNRRTTHDYLGEAIKKVGKIHTRLPPGGILVFLTGQQEIVTVCKKLEAAFGRKAIAKRKERATGLHWAQGSRRKTGASADTDDKDGDDQSKTVERVELAAQDGDVEAEDVDFNARSGEESAPLADVLGVDESAAQDELDAEALDTESEADEDSDEGGDDDGVGLRNNGLQTDVPLHILPLYSLLPSDKQMRVFDDPPEDARVVIVATNVAETSLTIPGIKYVVDCGRAKERQFDLISGVQSFEVGWISKASASQRAGRAGRTGPGHAYRLYSSALYEDHFEEFSSPEIVRTPVEGLVLQMKAMNIDQVTHFPFPTPPDRRTIADAERALVRLGALEEAEAVSDEQAQGPSSSAAVGMKKHNMVARVTDLGKVMSYFPVAPRFGKMLVQGRSHGCLPYVIIVVAALTVGDPFIRENSLDDGESDDDEDGNGRKGGKKGKEALDWSDPDAVALANLKTDKQREKELRKLERKRYFKAHQQFAALGNGLSDVFRLLSVVGAYEHEGGSIHFCDENYLRVKAMEEIHKLRAQLSSIVGQSIPGLDAESLRSLRTTGVVPPSDLQLKLLRQLLCAAFIDQVAVRADLVDGAAGVDTDAYLPQQWRSLREGGQGPNRISKMKSTCGVPYRALGLGLREAAYIHPSSILFHQRPPEWIIFSERQRSAPKHVADKKAEGSTDGVVGELAPEREGIIWLRTCTVINPNWLSSLGKKMCNYSKPAATGGASDEASNTAALAEALRMAKARAKGQTGEGGEVSAEREVVLIPSFGAGLGAAGLGWELPPVKAKQRLVKGRWVTDM